MKIFIPVYFNAPLGGLQANVLAQVKLLLGAGHSCTVMCKPGEFADSLKNVNVQVLETTYEFLDKDIELAIGIGPFDIVHAHPFASRKVGHAVAKQLQIPFLLSFHGAYLDSLPTYSKDVDILVTVSSAIRDFIITNKCFPPERIVVIPNGVDTNIFHQMSIAPEKVKQNYPVLNNLDLRKEDRLVLFACRLDKDKQFILEVVKETWNNMIKTRAYDIVWLIAGDGTLRPEMEAAAAEINSAASRQLITFLGWQSEPSLAMLFNTCHLAIAPGRSALESMACGKPVIAIGSKGYVGLIDSEKVMNGIYSNFGGFGSQYDHPESDALFRDIDRVIYDEEILSDLGMLSQNIVRTFFEQRKLDEDLLRLYNFVCNLRSIDSLEKNRMILLSYPGLHFFMQNAIDNLSPVWQYPRNDERWRVTVSPGGHLTAELRMTEEDKFYLTNGSANFSMPPSDCENWEMEAGCFYEIHASAHVCEGAPSVQLWVIEYSLQNRLTHTNLILQEGSNRLEFTTSSETACFKIAFRFSGEGIIELSPPKIFKKEEESPWI